jgi:uncharacterized protein (TIGR02391 family)
MSSLQFHEVVLLMAAELQGAEPPNLVPQHQESELMDGLQRTEVAKNAADRNVLLAALTELENRGWMKLLKVMGPWSWQMTASGLDKATKLNQQLQREAGDREKELRTAILRILDKNRRVSAGSSGLPKALNVDAFCRQEGIDEDAFIIQCERLIDQGLVEPYPFEEAELRNGQLMITESGRQQLDAPAPGAAPTRETAEVFRENAHLRRQLETLQSQPDTLIRDAQLRERVLPLIAQERNYDTAIREACVILEDRVRSRAAAAASLYGVNLMTAAFHEETGALILAEIATEQAGAHQVFRGMVAWIRNSFGHRLRDATAHGDALRIVAFVDYLLDEVSRATERRP